MGYVYLNDLYDAVANSTALSNDDKLDLIEHIAETTDPSFLRNFVTEKMVNDWLEEYPGDLVPFINDNEVERYIEEQGSLCLDKFLDDDLIVDYCEGHGYKVLMDNDEKEEFVHEWCKEHNMRLIFKDKTEKDEKIKWSEFIDG